MKIAVGMSTIPRRFKQAEKTVRQFMDHPQAESFTLYVDDYETVPGWTHDSDILNHAECQFLLARPSPEYPLKGDLGKLLCFTEDADVYVLLDDDLEYPCDYLEDIAEHCDEECPVVTYHGVDFFKDWNCPNAYESRTVYGFGEAWSQREVDLGGTGVMAIHRSAVNVLEPLLVIAAYPNMLDIHVAVQAAYSGIPITLLEHSEGWIKQAVHDVGIYESRGSDPLKNEISVAMIKYLLTLRERRGVAKAVL